MPVPENILKKQKRDEEVVKQNVEAKKVRHTANLKRKSEYLSRA